MQIIITFLLGSEAGRENYMYIGIGQLFYGSYCTTVSHCYLFVILKGFSHLFFNWLCYGTVCLASRF